MLIVERLLIITLARQDLLTANGAGSRSIKSLLAKAHVAAAMADLEHEGVISFTPAYVGEPWNMDDPVVTLEDNRTPSHPGLNDLYAAIHKGAANRKELSTYISKGSLDPRQPLIEEMARNGVLVQTEDGGMFRDDRYEPVLETTVAEILVRLVQVLRGNAEPSREDRLLLGILEATNMAGIAFHGTEYSKTQSELSTRIHELDGDHPVLSVLNKLTESAPAMMAKSALGPVRQQAAAN